MHWVYPIPHRQANDDLFMFGRAPLSVFTFHRDHGTGRHSNYDKLWAKSPDRFALEAAKYIEIHGPCGLLFSSHFLSLEA